MRFFVAVDVCALAALSGFAVLVGAPEVIPALLGGYFLGFQTGGEAA